ncbi:hypothetical protein B808_166 [Fructilactobacillus florum 8D]|uniref:Uncharacterized protein n=1 Tax=Fructilactobacillus florum 8D TaxID=1221538 RepID=W9EI30_9LACO|nr:hypothetical protein B808_166 [Fructilactobacillus florum 8D]
MEIYDFKIFLGNHEKKLLLLVRLILVDLIGYLLWKTR